MSLHAERLAKLQHEIDFIEGSLKELKKQPPKEPRSGDAT